MPFARFQLFSAGVRYRNISRKRRKNQLLLLNIQMETQAAKRLIIRILAILARAVSVVISFRKTPWQMTVKWREGFMSVAYCKVWGMLTMGVMAPESRMQGAPMVNAPQKRKLLG